jgi:hypothetical protein
MARAHYRCLDITERIDHFIADIDLEVEEFLLAHANWKNLAEVKLFVQKKRNAFFVALCQERQNIIASARKYESKCLDCMRGKLYHVDLGRPIFYYNYFFRYQLDGYKPDESNYEFFLGYLYIVRDGCISEVDLQKAKVFTENLFTESHEYTINEVKEPFAVLSNVRPFRGDSGPEQQRQYTKTVITKIVNSFFFLGSYPHNLDKDEFLLLNRFQFLIDSKKLNTSFEWLAKRTGLSKSSIWRQRLSSSRGRFKSG